MIQVDNPADLPSPTSIDEFREPFINAIGSGFDAEVAARVRTVPKLFKSRRLPIHVAMIQVCPPDDFGLL